MKAPKFYARSRTAKDRQLDALASDTTGDADAIVRLAGAVISDAVEMAIVPNRSKNRVSELCWLASKAASWWFDTAGADQHAALERVGWARVAREVLASPFGSPRQRALLEAGLDVVRDVSPAYVLPTMDRGALDRERRQSAQRQRRRGS